MGETPSTDTGPDHDHTKKSDKGKTIKRVRHQ